MFFFLNENLRSTQLAQKSRFLEQSPQCLIQLAEVLTEAFGYYATSRENCRRKELFMFLFKLLYTHPTPNNDNLVSQIKILDLLLTSCFNIFIPSKF